MANTSHPQYLLLMKVGPYCGYTLDEIIDIKQKEESSLGKFFWGYSGVFCRPHVLQNFVSHSKRNNQDITVLFSETKSSFSTPNVEKFDKYSSNSSTWIKLPKEVLLIGNKQKPHFAITGENLKKKDMKIDIGKYCTLMGTFPNPQQYLDTYFRYRVDKACGYYLPKKETGEKIVEIKYICDLIDPYTLYIK